MHRITSLFIVGSLLIAASAAQAEEICLPSCQGNPPNFIEVPVEGRNYAGPTKFEGDIYSHDGIVYNQFKVTVSILIDGTLSPLVALSIKNPGKTQFVRWETAPLTLPPGPHTMLITTTDLAHPDCPTVDVVHFLTR